jgi:hypothetical protein
MILFLAGWKMLRALSFPLGYLFWIILYAGHHYLQPDYVSIAVDCIPHGDFVARVPRLL